MTPTTHPRRPVRRSFALIAALALWAGAAVAQAPLGGPAPDFTLTGNDGQDYTLSDGFGSTVQILHMIGYA
ncbi:hypothetical protein GF314_09450 [bacterium]|nr:hypothetical protein [bacterium]